MSRSRLRPSLFIDNLPGGFHCGAEIRIADHPFGQQIHLTSQQVLQRLGKLQKRVRVTGVTCPAKLHNEIEVAPLRLKITARRRTKKIKPSDLVPSAQVGDARFLLFDERDHSATLAQGDKAVQPTASAANVQVANAASQSFQTGS